MEIKRGDIVYLRTTDNNDVLRKRPYVIVSNDVGNHFAGICLAVPLTTRMKKLNMPTHTIIDYHGSMVMTEQIHTIRQEDIERVAHHLNRADMQNIESCLKNSLGL